MPEIRRLAAQRVEEREELRTPGIAPLALGEGVFEPCLAFLEELGAFLEGLLRGIVADQTQPVDHHARRGLMGIDPSRNLVGSGPQLLEGPTETLDTLLDRPLDVAFFLENAELNVSRIDPECLTQVGEQRHVLVFRSLDMRAIQQVLQ